jgi:glc operon protein GlcG
MPFADTKRLTTRDAKAMLAAATAKAEALGVVATVAIVDAGGHLLCLERMDKGRFHTVHSSTAKAVSAASNKRPTTTRGAVGQELDLLHAIGLTLAAGPERWTAHWRAAIRCWSRATAPAASASPAATGSRTRRLQPRRWRLSELSRSEPMNSAMVSCARASRTLFGGLQVFLPEALWHRCDGPVS